MNSGKINRSVFRRKRTPGEAYEKDCSRLQEGLFGTLIQRIRPGTAAMMKVKMKLASLCENFPLTKLLFRFVHRLRITRVRSSSVGFLCFGFLCAALTLLRLFLGKVAAPEAVMELGFSLGVVLGTLPLAMSKHTWGEISRRSILGGFVFDLLGCFRSDELQSNESAVSGGRVSVIVGVVLGLLSFLVSPFRLAAGFLLVLLLALIFYKPEFGLSLLTLIFAFVAKETLALLAFVVLLSFLWKILRGKRVLSIEPVDVFGFFLLLILAGGSAFGLMDSYTVWLGFMLFVLFSKGVTSTEQSRRLSNLFIVVLFLFSLFFFLRLWLSVTEPDWISRFGLSFLGENGYVLPLDMLMMLLPVAAVGAMQKGKSKLFSILSLVLGLGVLIFSKSPGALLCLAFSLIVLTVLLGKRMIAIFVFLAAALAGLFVFAPAMFHELFGNVPTLFLDTLSEQGNALSLIFSRNWLEILFGSVLPAEESLNFWADFLYRFGLMGVLAFGVFIVLLFRKAMGPRAFTRETHTLRLCFGLQLAVVMLLMRGVTATFTDDVVVFSFFWLVCGILCGVSNVAHSMRRREEF